MQQLVHPLLLRDVRVPVAVRHGNLRRLRRRLLRETLEQLVDELAQGDVQTLLLEQTMLSNFTALPKYALPDQPGRLSYFDLLAFITV